MTDTIRPPLEVKRPGWFIHEFTATTDIAPPMPLTAIGTPVQKGAQPPRPRRLCQGFAHQARMVRC